MNNDVIIPNLRALAKECSHNTADLCNSAAAEIERLNARDEWRKECDRLRSLVGYT